jgi:ABC-2 type transport system permease protein
MMVIHRDKLRWLFWLRWKLFLRGFSRDRRHLIGTIFTIIFGLPIFGGIAVGTYFGYRLLAFPANAELLFLVLTGVYLLWLVLPLFEFTVNEGLDVSKLRLFPLTRPELMSSLLLSTLLDFPMLGLLLVLLAVIVGWAISVPVALFAILAMLVFWVQVVGISQLVLALLMRTLQSRRFRDLSIILIAAFSSICYISSQLVSRALSSGGLQSNLQHAVYSVYLQWLPPGMTARAIEQSVVGNWGYAFIWLAAALVIAVVELYLWSVVLEHSLSTAEVGGSVRTRSRRAAAAPTTTTAQALPQQASVAGSFWERLGSSQTFAITFKEWRYFWRDPQMKALLFQSIIYVVIVIIAPILGAGRAGGGSSTIASLVAPLIVFLSVFLLSFNTLGLERQSLTTLFLFPIDGKRILLGKNTSVAPIGGAELVLLIVITSIIGHNWSFALPMLVVGLAGIAVVLGCGNVTSVLFPIRMRTFQRGIQATGSSSGNAGCLRSVMSFAMMIVTAIVLVPVAASAYLPLIFHMQWVWVFSIPVALLYAVAFYWIVLWLIAPRMQARVPEILAQVVRE